MKSAARAPLVLVVLFIGLVLASALPAPFSPTQRAAAANVTIFSDGFESSFPGTAWNVTDAEPKSGLDYWGKDSTLITAHTGTYSAWCAEIGTSSTSGNTNVADGEYDTNMTAAMKHALPDLSGYVSVNLSFWVWYSIGPGDSLGVEASPNGLSYSELLGISQGTSSGWVQENVTVPLGTRSLMFVFGSDASTVSIGAFLDDVTVVGVDATPPTIVHTPVTTATVGQAIPISASITDNVAVAQATLYYESVGQSVFASLPMTAAGSTYTATIPPQASTGNLRYYIQATDGAGNAVLSPTSGATNAYSVAVQAPPVSPAGLPLEWIAIGAIVLVVVVAAAALLIRRRGRAPSPGAVSPTGPSSLPPSPIAPASQPAPPVVAPTIAPAAAPVPGHCPACGLQNEASAIFCNRCATRLR